MPSGGPTADRQSDTFATPERPAAYRSVADGMMG